MTRAEVYAMIDQERARQAVKWTVNHDWGVGDCSSLAVAEPVKIAVLSEEVGEVARAVLERDSVAIEKELTQVAAVAVAWLEGLSIASPPLERLFVEPGGGR
jgi:hypothetical protein